MKFLRFLNCVLLDRPKNVFKIAEGRFEGKGDYAAEWGLCARCDKLCHRDTRIFGDGIWRHERS